ncbi:MAG: reverse transcriptase domain-containing protein [Proteobacteria bacterium]|nr:reverse transcriptase domain-containing protein [Pseudomonadota bacterium]
MPTRSSYIPAAADPLAFFSMANVWRAFGAFQRKQRERRKYRPDDQLTLSELVRNADRLVPLALGAIRERDFVLQPARPIIVRTDKPRTVHQFEWLDQFIIDYFAEWVAERTRALLPDCLFSFRPMRSSAMAVERAAAFVACVPHHERVWAMRRDVKSYGESLQHTHVLADFAAALGPSPELATLLGEICRFPKIEADGTVQRNTRGLPTGSYVQLVFENLYLLALDRELECVPRSLYLRYGDDILFLTLDEGAFSSAQARVAAHLHDRGLEFNESKSRQLGLSPSHQAGSSRGDVVCSSEFDYLGARITFKGDVHLDLKKQRKVTGFIRRKLAQTASHFPTASPDEKIAALIATVRTLCTERGIFRTNPIHTYVGRVADDNALRELDKWVAQTVLKLGLGRGFKKGLFRRYPYRRLRELGLPSMLHLTRTNGLR